MLPKQDFYHKEYSDTIVGNDVWIGYNALIMPGIKIGDGARYWSQFYHNKRCAILYNSCW